MAKRYFSHLDLRGVNNQIKPGGTLGNHYLEVCDLVDGSVLVEGFNPRNLSKQERKQLEKYQLYLSVIDRGGEWFGEIPKDPIKPLVAISKVILRPEWTLGYDCGEVWAIQPVHLIKDPIRKALREELLPKNCINWVDDLYSIGTDREDFVSSKVIVTRSSRVYDRASMARTFRIERINVLKGTDPTLVAQAIKEPSKVMDIFGPLEQRLPDISHWLANSFFERVVEHVPGMADLEFVTGRIQMYFSHRGDCQEMVGSFKDLEFTPNQKWEGRGYLGGHNSVGSNVDTNEEGDFIARLILDGKKGKNLTRYGTYTGYYPKVEWEE